MALRDQYTARNQLVTEELRVTLTQDYNDVGTSPNPQPVTRTVTKNYSYIGMTKKAARECQLAKIAQYTRRVELAAEPGGHKPTAPLECLAQITLSRASGENYSVDIDVNYADSFDPIRGDASRYPGIRDHLVELAREQCLDEPLDICAGVSIDRAEYSPYTDNAGTWFDRVFIANLAQSVYPPEDGASWTIAAEITDDPFFGEWVALTDRGNTLDDGRLVWERRRPDGSSSGSFDRGDGRVIYIRMKYVCGDAIVFRSNVIAQEFFPFHFRAAGV